MKVHFSCNIYNTKDKILQIFSDRRIIILELKFLGIIKPLKWQLCYKNWNLLHLNWQKFQLYLHFDILHRIDTCIKLEEIKYKNGFRFMDFEWLFYHFASLVGICNIYEYALGSYFNLYCLQSSMIKLLGMKLFINSPWFHIAFNFLSCHSCYLAIKMYCSVSDC